MSASAPLTPPDSDLRSFPFMPLQVARLRDSGMAAEIAPEAGWYAVLLWAAAWHQLPAGSLPDNDAALMRLAGLGRDARTWRRHREAALRGFVLCSDGRLYHPVIAEQVHAAWAEKRAYRARKDQRSAIARKAAAVRWAGHAASPAGAAPGDAGAMPDALPKETGTGTGRLGGDDDARIGADPIALAAELCRIAGVRHVEPAAILRAQGVVRQWLAEGFDPAGEIVPAIRAAVSAATADRISSLAYFDGPLRQLRARKEARDHGHAPRTAAGPAAGSGAGTAPTLRGPRPDPALDMWRDAQHRLAADEDGGWPDGAAPDPGADLGTGAALPPYLADRYRGA